MRQLALVKEHPELEHIHDKLKFLRKSTNKKLEDLQDKYKEIKESARDEEKSIWEDVADYLLSSNLVDNEFQLEDYLIAFDEDDGTLLAESREVYGRRSMGLELTDFHILAGGKSSQCGGK